MRGYSYSGVDTFGSSKKPNREMERDRDGDHCFAICGRAGADFEMCPFQQL